MMQFCGVRMVKLDTEVSDVVLDCELANSIGVVPVKVNSVEQVSLPVLSYFVVFLEGSPEVNGVTLANVLNTKVIHF